MAQRAAWCQQYVVSDEDVGDEGVPLEAVESASKVARNVGSRRKLFAAGSLLIKPVDIFEELKIKKLFCNVSFIFLNKQNSLQLSVSET